MKTEMKASSKPENALGEAAEIDAFSLKMTIAASALFSVLSCILFDKTKDLSGIRMAVFGLVIVALVGGYLAFTKKLTVKNIILMLFSAGFVIRLNYVLITTVSFRVRQHDLYKFGEGRGHSGYIEHFYNNGFTLPDINPLTKAQFYHPPLHHFLAALWMRLLTTYGMSYQRAIESLPFLTLFYSMCSLVLCERIFDKLNLRGYGKMVALSIAAFHPTFLLFSGSVNNDNLSFLLTLLAIYATLKWYNEPSMGNIFLIAAAVGLGMSTKLSVALVAPAIAIVFIIKTFWENDNMFKKIWKQYVVFAVVCIPLGLWYYIRNSVRFDIKITYVPKLSVKADQYVGFHSVYERLLDFSNHPFKNVFVNKVVNGEGEYFEYNPFVVIMKSSLFGEYTFTRYYDKITPFCQILLILNFIMVLLSLIAMLYCVIRKSSFINYTVKVFIILFYIITMTSYFIFAFKYPHNCSMDFRYLPVTVVIGSLFIGMAAEQIKIDFPKRETVVSTLRYFVGIVTFSFCIMSSLVYIMLGL